MGVTVVAFPQARARNRDWTQDELAELYRVVDILGRAGVQTFIDMGLSDEGEPWLVVCRSDNGDVLAHFARIDGQFVAASTAIDETFRGANFRQIVDRLARSQPLMVPLAQTEGGGARLYMHPSVVLTAFVATALALSGHDDASPHRAVHSALDGEGAAGSAGDSHGHGLTTHGPGVAHHGAAHHGEAVRTAAHADGRPAHVRVEIAVPHAAAANAAASAAPTLTLANIVAIAMTAVHELEAAAATGAGRSAAGTESAASHDASAAAAKSAPDAAAAGTAALPLAAAATVSPEHDRIGPPLGRHELTDSSSLGAAIERHELAMTHVDKPGFAETALPLEVASTVLSATVQSGHNWALDIASGLQMLRATTVEAPVAVHGGSQPAGDAHDLLHALHESAGSLGASAVSAPSAPEAPAAVAVSPVSAAPVLPAVVVPASGTALADSGNAVIVGSGANAADATHGFTLRDVSLEAIKLLFSAETQLVFTAHNEKAPVSGDVQPVEGAVETVSAEVLAAHGDIVGDGAAVSPVAGDSDGGTPDIVATPAATPESPAPAVTVPTGAVAGSAGAGAGSAAPAVDPLASLFHTVASFVFSPDHVLAVEPSLSATLMAAISQYMSANTGESLRLVVFSSDALAGRIFPFVPGVLFVEEHNFAVSELSQLGPNDHATGGELALIGVIDSGSAAA